MDFRKTKRVVVDALEDILYESQPVLDHGFIRVIDYMGSDSAIVQAARVSYGKGTKHVNQDKALINYLMRNFHTSPFEMCEIKFHIKFPIFVARQWIRHRTANVNEYSARYSVVDNEFYLPELEILATQSKLNKQGRSEALPANVACSIRETLKQDANLVYEHYQDFLNQDLTRELARLNLTLNYYTECYWKIDLHNLLHFLKLRSSNHAQYEIKVYADKILEIVQKWVPFTYEAFINYHLEAKNMSANDLDVIRQLVKDKTIDGINTKISEREKKELIKVLWEHDSTN